MPRVLAQAHRRTFANSAFPGHFSLAFSRNRSDQSSCAKPAQKGKPEPNDERRSQHKGAPEKASSKKGATRAKNAPKGQKTAKGGKATPKKTAAKKTSQAKEAATAPRAEGKGAKVLELIARSKGATLAELMKATDWQAHSIRGFISTAIKKYKVTIESAKNDKGERVYRNAS